MSADMFAATPAAEGDRAEQKGLARLRVGAVPDGVGLALRQLHDVLTDAARASGLPTGPRPAASRRGRRRVSVPGSPCSGAKASVNSSNVCRCSLIFCSSTVRYMAAFSPVVVNSAGDMAIQVLTIARSSVLVMTCHRRVMLICDFSLWSRSRVPGAARLVVEPFRRLSKMDAEVLEREGAGLLEFAAPDASTRM